MTEEEIENVIAERDAFKGENAHLKKNVIPNLERKIASIRGNHKLVDKKLKARLEQVERLKEELYETSSKKGEVEKENEKLKKEIAKFNSKIDTLMDFISEHDLDEVEELLNKIDEEEDD